MDKTPQEIYATLLDEGQYYCSIRTMYRILDHNNEVKERRNQRNHPVYTKPQLLTTFPNQVWSWDITKLLGACLNVIDIFRYLLIYTFFMHYIIIFLLYPSCFMLFSRFGTGSI